MKKTMATHLLTVLLMGLTTQVMAEATTESSTGSATVATVNGNTITEEMVQIYGAQRSHNPGAQQLSHEAAIEELVNIELVTQDAEKQGIDKRPNVVKQLEWQRRSLMVGVSMREYVASHPVSDEELKAAYDEQVKKHDGHEYQARHILVATEAEAKDLIAQLDKGGDFAKLASEKSTDPSGKQNGGDLGWFSTDQMVKPFSDAVAKMKKGQVSKKPVESQFGWHIIKLEDTRDVPAPTFDSLKEQLTMQLQNQRVEKYLAELRKDAKIEILKK